jgi:chemotaxis protein MotB
MPARSGARRGSHGSARRRRHSAEGEHGEGGSERWLVTYADMLTLLLVLFIVLFSISVVNTSKFISLKTSLATAFGSGTRSILAGGNSLLDNSSDGQGQTMVQAGVPFAGAAHDSEVTSANPQVGDVPAGGVPTSAPAPKAASSALRSQADAEVSRLKAIEKAVDRALVRRGMTSAARFAINQRGLVITVVTNQLVFPGNSADLLPEGRTILGVIAPQLRPIPNDVEVDGYTNQEKVSTYPYPSGWELSSARASAVVRYLIGAGVQQDRLSAVGFSDQRPLYPASDPRSVTLNRRVEIVVLTGLSADAAALLPAAASS